MSTEQPFDLAAVAADDALLEALGQGMSAPADDELAGMLAAWRGDLDADQPAPPVPVLVEPEPRRTGRFAKFVTGIAAALLVLGGLAVAAGNAGPNSPLWPLTKVMYPQQADVRAAQHAIASARAAVAAGRFDDARRLLDEATRLVDRIDDKKTQQRLRDEIAQVRAMLVDGSGTSTPGPGTTPPSTGATPPGGGATPPTNPTPGPGGGATTAGPGGGNGPLPGLPTPSLPVPKLPLPTPTLPGLPIPTPSLPIPSLPIPSLPI
jgi:hypothetical protein